MTQNKRCTKRSRQTKIDIEKYLKGFIRKIKDNKRELARWSYLAVTGKFENQFRDFFAYYLYRNLGRDLLVGRDLSVRRKPKREFRADIALIKRNETVAECILELKAAYLFDAYAKPRSYMNKKCVHALWKDIATRWKRIRSRYGVLLVTDIPYQNDTALLDRLPVQTIKYLEGMRRDAAKLKKSGRTGEKWRLEAVRNIHAAFRKNHLREIVFFRIPMKYGSVSYSLLVYLVKFKKG